MISPELCKKCSCPCGSILKSVGAFVTHIHIAHARISVLYESRSLAEILSWNAQPLKSSEGQGHFLGVIWTFSTGGFLDLFPLAADPASSFLMTRIYRDSSSLAFKSCNRDLGGSHDKWSVHSSKFRSEVSGQRGVLSAPLTTFWASLSSCLCFGREGSRGHMALSASQGKASFCCTRPVLWLLTFSIFICSIQGVLKPRVPSCLFTDSLQHPSSGTALGNHIPRMSRNKRLSGEQQHSQNNLCWLRSSLWIFTEGRIF